MKPTKRTSLRLVGGAVLFGLLAILSGDRALTANSPQGQDPLEVLNLQVKPNVIFVLDSSGSMQETTAAVDTRSGDNIVSKMGQAKAVLTTVITDNNNKANFMFGQYTQAGTSLQSPGYVDLSGNEGRYQWITTDTTMPDAQQLNARLFSTGLPLVVDGTNNRFFYEEVNSGNTTVTASCTPTVASGTYTSGALLATAIQNAMNAACTNKQSTYGVTFDTVNWRFIVTRTASCGGANCPRRFRLLASNGAGSPDLGPDVGWTANTGLTNGPANGANLGHLLYRPSCTAASAGCAYVDGGVTYRQARSTRMFNGQTITSLADGTICGVAAGAPGDGSATNPYYFMLQRKGTCGGANTGTPIKFTLSGGRFDGNSISCNGFNANVPLALCNTATVQITAIAPFLRPEIDTTGGRTGTDCTNPATCPVAGYRERRSGLLVTQPTFNGIQAAGSTPIANSLRDIRGTNNDPAGSVQRNWTNLWEVGQVAPPLTAIKSHTNPKEKTVVMFVTDGDDTCSGSGDTAARAAAYQAELLYRPLRASISGTRPFGVEPDGTIPSLPSVTNPSASDPASSVTTYVINYGTGASLTRSNWIAWGGSGMQIPNDGVRWTRAPILPTERNKCTTCQDAKSATTADDLKQVLEALLNQGVQEGEFSAQQSVIGQVYEFAPSNGGGLYTSAGPPSVVGATNYEFQMPVRIVSKFTLPGFKGEIIAYTGTGPAGAAVEQWRAGQKMHDAIVLRTTDTAVCRPKLLGGPAQCTFGQLHGSATEATVSGSPAAIRRRIYTTNSNGTFFTTAAALVAGTATGRRTIWPPEPTIAPTLDATVGNLDAALGIGSLLYNTAATTDIDLFNNFHACQGSPVLPAACSGTATQQLNRGRREAREMILSFMAGARPLLDVLGNPLRVPAGTIDASATPGEILYEARPWMLGDSTLATPAVVSPPFDFAATGGLNPATHGTEYVDFVEQWVKDLSDPTPAITVVYVPANDMLHAFRAGPGGGQSGGEELWGFVPFDVLNVVMSRYLQEPAKRNPHDYVIASAARFADVFVPDGGGSGVWRMMLLVGRGIGGRYLTALDVTPRASYTTAALQVPGPLPLWNRGNPDTTNGLPAGPAVRAADTVAYSKMGETWSVPAVAFVDKTFNVVQNTARGVEWVAYVGSGYGPVAGNTGEGTFFYTLDVLTGDVVRALDTEAAAAAHGLQRVGAPFANAIPVSPTVFNKSRFRPGRKHPAAEASSRVYFGDLHGRLWKVLSKHPDTLIPVSDLGADQAVATSASLLGIPRDNPEAYIFLGAGNDLRLPVPPDVGGKTFKLFAFHDAGDDDNVTPSGTSTDDGVVTFAPADKVFAYRYGADVGPPPATTVPVDLQGFRGTVQPLTLFDAAQITPTNAGGQVFYAGTRFNPPNTPNAPPGIPCRSSFDTIFYGLNGQTGLATYDLDASAAGTEAFVKIADKRGVGIDSTFDPVTKQGKVSVDYSTSLAPKPPSPPGEAPSVTSGATTVAGLRPGFPPPMVRLGSAVCNY